MLDPSANLLLVVFPMLLGVGIWNALRGPKEHRAVHVYMLVTVLWVTAVANLVEIGENDRMRWEIEPFLAIWAACAATALPRLVRSLRSRQIDRGARGVAPPSSREGEGDGPEGAST
jgi:hypothetical protein